MHEVDLLAQFLAGSKGAYAMILEAFWRGDKDELLQLCDADVYEGFSAAIDARAAAGEVIDARNQADALIYSVEKTFTENKAKLGAEAAQVESALAKAKEAVKGDDKAAITGALEELQKASHAMAEVLYKATATGAAHHQDPADTVKDGEVVDAEFAEAK